MKTVKLTKNKTQTYKPASIKSISDFGAKTGQKVNGKLHTVLPIDQIKVKAQVRTIFENIDELAESMKEGQLLPITVTPDEEEGGYTILQGERRWLAAKKAGLTKIEVMVVDKPKSETDRIYGQLTENIQRENMKLCDLVSSISCLIEMGNSQTEIAKRLGKDRTYISRIASLNNSHPIVAEFIKQSFIQDPQTAQIANLICDKSANPEASLNSIRDENGSISRASAQRLLNSLVDQPKKPTTIKKARPLEDQLKKKEIPTGFKKLPSSAPIGLEVSFVNKDGMQQEGYLLTRLISNDSPEFCVLCKNDHKVIQISPDKITLQSLREIK